MAIGSKYAALTEWLLQCNKESVRLTFAELNEIITIPNYAYKGRPSWANLTKPSSFCSGWINAGYVVGSISLKEQWVEFRKGETKGYEMKPRTLIKRMDQKAISAALQCGYDCYDDIATDPHHRYLSWEYCHEAFKQHRQQQDGATVDYLCLHLACTEAYVASGAGIPTETLLTKILLGTIGCVPAYDRYFKKAVSLTGAASQSCNARSLMALGKLYIDRRDEFEALRRHCSDRVEYPAAKVIDMCFFEYGFKMDGGNAEE